MDSSDVSRVLLKLGREAVGRRLVTDILSKEGMVLLGKGTVLDDVAIDKLLKKGITIVLVEPDGKTPTRATLDRMFERHKNDPFMAMLYAAALDIVEPREEGGGA